MRKLVRNKKTYKWWLAAMLCCFMLSPAFAQQLASHWHHEDGKKARQTDQQFALTQMLSDWEKEFNVNFYYDSELLKGLQIDEKAGKNVQDVEKSLTDILASFQLKCEKIAENAYVIRPAGEAKESLEKLEKKPSDNGLQTGSAAGTQAVGILQNKGLNSLVKFYEKTITGKVTDENDEGLPGVNILVKIPPPERLLM